MHRLIRRALWLVSHPLLTIPACLAALMGLMSHIIEDQAQMPAWQVFATGLLGCMALAIIVTGLMSERRH